jgi:mRNA interferase RelE/StbE
VFKIEFTSKAEKELSKLPKQVISKILDKITALAVDPKPPGYKKLTNFHIANAPDDLYRIRIGDYRAIYTIDGNVLIITVVKIAHRSEVYEG